MVWFNHRNANRWFFLYLKFIFLIFLTGSFICAEGQKTDKLTLLNGDTLTGEIMSMKLGILTYKMDGPGTINIKWEYVTGIRSNKVFDFTLRNGEIIVAGLDSLFQSHQKTHLD